MTQEELDKIIETDLFQMRGFAIRYIDYGKQLAQPLAAEIFKELEQVDIEIRAMQSQVERTEKEALQALKSANQDKPELMAAFEAVISNTDKAHTDILVIKKAMIDGVKAKFGM